MGLRELVGRWALGGKVVSEAGAATKTSSAGPIVAWSQVGRPKWTPRRYDALADEGFRKNVIAYRCVMMVAAAASGVSWLLYDEAGAELERHPLLDLLRHPNPLQDGVAFLENVYAHLQIAGNAYVEAVRPSDAAEPLELYALRPDRMKVIPGPTGLPQGYEYNVNGKVTRWGADPITGASSILHIKAFHPLDDWYGMAPLEAALLSVDQHNAAGAWNQALLNQGARPSGALVFAPKEGPASLSDDQMQRLREEMDQLYQGKGNAGRPLILEGGLDWREMSLSPKDMDWLAGRDAAARDVALAFGVPAQLVGIPGAQTYANMAEARLALYEETVVPLVDRVMSAFDHWLAPMFDDSLTLDFDLDAITALAVRRDAHWDKLQGADFLTVNEKRAAAGYGPVSGGDKLAGAKAAALSEVRKYSPEQPRVPAGNPDGGQWTADGPDEPGLESVYPIEMLILPFLRSGRLIDAMWSFIRSAQRNADWQFGTFKSPQRWANQMENRNWTPEEITNIIKNGDKEFVENRVNQGNPAIQYTDPKTGRFVVRDERTREILQISGQRFSKNPRLIR